jgi:hypothetical protein
VKKLIAKLAQLMELLRSVVFTYKKRAAGAA